ncbi:uncharacterized protein LOC143253995 [Tachypleus tridentatus]|uniref:uncharacterized protein LOC143253995 n=1 Tax=Tachypleus tridentatus TaxID=6853 RepID=UPI003FD12896
MDRMLLGGAVKVLDTSHRKSSLSFGADSCKLPAVVQPGVMPGDGSSQFGSSNMQPRECSQSCEFQHPNSENVTDEENLNDELNELNSSCIGMNGEDGKFCSSNLGVRRRPILRSKSDVSGFSFSRDRSELSSKRSSRDSAELERFFDTMGLDASVWKNIIYDPQSSSPTCFLNVGGATFSDDHQSQACSEYSSIDSHKGDAGKEIEQLNRPKGTSIVEKNARVIKWLCGCRRALDNTGC